MRAPDRRDWKRAYRQAKTRWHYQIVRLDHDDAQTLRAIAKRDGITVAELIRTFVTWGLEECELTDARRGRED
jgi:predicted DNA-binding ribbon-helix-helix protein